MSLRRSVALLPSLLLCWGLGGCDEKEATLPDVEQRDPQTGLTPAEEDEVLVRVGESAITLGQFAETLRRMDPYERLRYKSEERQKQLLDEMIEVELLAQEARRQGLDRDPEIRLRINQALRDELLEDLERRVPGPESFSQRQVQEYYEAHRDEFNEPLRHRVSVIEVGSASLAQSIISQLEAAGSSSGAEWARLSRQHSLRRTQLGLGQAPELAGDLGFVSAPGKERGANPDVPEAVREAVFQLEKVGEVAERPVQVGERHFVVRLEGISPARNRTLQQAERTIRVELRRRKFLEMEQALERELEKKFPVVVRYPSEESAPADETKPESSPAIPGQPDAPGATKDAP